MGNIIILIFTIIFSLITTYFCLAFIIKIANKYNLKNILKDTWVDVPKKIRPKSHDYPISRLGGLAIYFSFFIVLSIFIFLFKEKFLANNMIKMQLICLYIGGTLFTILGLIDDIKGLSYKSVFTFSSIILAFLYIFFIKNLNLNTPFFFIHDIRVINFILFVIWFSIIINSINLIDGVDGLASGIIIISTLYMAIISYWVLNDYLLIITLSIIFSSCLVFLKFNHYPAKIFLGSSGSFLLGFLLAMVSIWIPDRTTPNNLLPYTIIILAVPLIDMFVVMIDRICHKLNPFSADSLHIHDRLFQFDLTPKTVSKVLWIMTMFSGFFALLSTINVYSYHLSILLLIIFFTFFYLYVMKYGKKHQETNLNYVNNKLKHHCMVVHAYYPLGETRVQRQAEFLVQKGYKVDVICLQNIDDKSEEIFNGVQIYRLPVNYKRSNPFFRVFNIIHSLVLASFQLYKLCKEKKYNTIQVHTHYNFYVFCAIIPKLRRIPIILDIHDLFAEFLCGRYEISPNRLSEQFLFLEERISCRFADHIIAVTENARQILINRSVLKSKCSVVMNLADENIFNQNGFKYSIDNIKDQFHLIYHGSIIWFYGLEIVIKAINIVKNTIPNIKLTIIGEGHQKKELQYFINSLNIEKHVIFMNFQISDKLPNFIRKAHIGIVPMISNCHTEIILPTKLMEYASLCIPVICSKTKTVEDHCKNTMVEFVKSNDVNDLARCILELYKFPIRLKTLSKNSRTFNKKYNWTQESIKYLNVIKKNEK